jgi:L-iditol 2-dehydrogenase
MRAAVLHGKEDVRIERLPVPVPGQGELLLRTCVALTCGTDVKVYRRGYHARMLAPPAPFGHEAAGIVEAAGPGAAFEPGARVVVANSAPCGACHDCGRGRQSQCADLVFWNGAYAEFALVPARIVSTNTLRVPAGLSLRRAAMTEPLACAVRGVERCGVESGQRVAVIGAGPIGLMLVALARAKGASVVCVGRNAGRLAAARALGAEATLEAAEGLDLAEQLRDWGPDGHGPEIVIEAVGRPDTSEAALRAVRKGGVVNLFAGCPAGSRIPVDLQRLHYEELTLTSTFHHTPATLRQALGLIAAGTVDPEAFITAESPLERLPDVLAHMAQGSDGLKTAVLPWGAEPRHTD